MRISFLSRPFFPRVFEAAVFYLAVLAAVLSLLALDRFLAMPVPEFVLWLIAIPLYLSLAKRSEAGFGKSCFNMAFFSGLIGVLMARFWDFTFDGQAYHLPGVVTIGDGWNPFGDNMGLLLIDSYPSGWWSLQAMVGKLYGAYDAGRLLNYLMLFITYGIAGEIARRLYGPMTKLLHALVLLSVFSFIVACQVNSFYNDHIVYLLTVCLAGGLYLLQKGQKREGLLISISAIILIINTKFTGGYYAVILCAVFMLAHLRTHRERAFYNAVRLLVAGLFAVFFVGYRPYVTNLHEHHSLVYPDVAAVLGPHRPAAFADMSQLGAMLHTIYNSPVPVEEQKQALRHPTMLLKAFGDYYAGPAPAPGGFGPLFGIATLLALAAHLLCLRGRKKLLSESYAAILTFIICAAFPQSWWGRLIGQLWLLPIFLLLPALRQPKAQRLAWVAVWLLLINMVPAFLWCFKETVRVNVDHRRYLNRQVRFYEGPAGGPIVPIVGSVSSTYAHIIWEKRLDTMGIRHMLLEKDCEHPLFKSTGVALCPGVKP